MATTTRQLDSLTVVVAAYNAERWIAGTLSSIQAALARGGIERYEIIVVDDGSTDRTAESVDEVVAIDRRVVLIRQENAGRLRARETGIREARFDTTLLLDSRIEVFPDSFVELNRYLADGAPSRVWNGHVTIRYGWNLFARFWGVVTFIGWRAYLRRPRYVEFGLEDFDWYPKGTGFLLAPTESLREATRTYDSLVDDARFASDDTGVLRNLARRHRIAIAPEFGCWYSYGRSSVAAFVKHTFDRGTFFVDSYFRPGTRYFVPLLAFLTISIAVLVLVPLAPLLVAATAGIAWLALFVAAMILGVPLRNAAAFAVVAPLFTVVFGTGVWRGAYFVTRTWLRRRDRRS